MDCPNCGRPIPAQAASCPSCGAALSSAAQTRPRRRLSNLALVAFVGSVSSGIWFLADGGSSWLPALCAASFFVLDVVALRHVGKRRRALWGWSFPLFAVLFLLLSLLLLPSVDRAGPKDFEWSCKNNFWGLGQAIGVYYLEHNGYYPPADRWCDALMEAGYVTDAVFLKCPAAGEARSSYAINSAVAGKRPDGSPQTVLLFEIDGGWNVSGGRERMISKPRHPGGFMFLLVNGEVKAVPKKELDRLEW